MKSKMVPLYGLLLAILIAAAVIVPGALTGDGGAIVEAVAQESSSVTVIDEPVFGAEVGQGVANCRYGAAMHKDGGYQKWIDDLGAGWWLDFQANYEVPAANGAEYVHVIWAEQKKSATGEYLDDYIVNPPIENDSLGRLIEKRPGRLWVVGNEVERGPDPGQALGGQGNTMPQMYARIYHDVYNYIKEWDPTAQVTPSALVQVTPGRMQYLDIVYNTYLSRYGETMPVDVWNMHLYVLAERKTNGTPSYFANIALGTDPALAILEADGNRSKCALDSVYCLAEHADIDAFAGQVELMRSWMKDHGYQYKPLIITEYSILLPYEVRPEPEGCWVKDEYGNCFTPERVRDFANATFNYLNTATDSDLGYPYDNNRLEQQWLWFSIYRTGNFRTSNLAASRHDPLNLTLAGQAFRDAARAEPETVNLVAAESNNPIGKVGPGGEVSARLKVAVRNNGNTRLNEPITVTFYRDEALTEVIATETLPAPDVDFTGMTGCAVRPLWVSIDAVWSDSTGPLPYRYWAKVDSGELIDETSENDNVTSGTILLVDVAGYVPLIAR